MAKLLHFQLSETAVGATEVVLSPEQSHLQLLVLSWRNLPGENGQNVTPGRGFEGFVNPDCTEEKLSLCLQGLTVNRGAFKVGTTALPVWWTRRK